MDKSKNKSDAFKALIPIILFLIFLFLFPMVLLRNEYNFFTSIIYVIAESIVLFAIIFGFQIFTDFKYFYEKKFKDKIKFNILNMVVVFGTYIVIMQVFSQFLYFSLRGFASLLEISFYPEKTIFIIPAFAGFFIFMTRMFSIFFPLKKNSVNKHVLDEFNDYNLEGKLNDYIHTTRNILRDMIIVAVIVGMIGMLIYGTSVFSLENGTYFYKSIFRYSLLFALADIFLGIAFAKTKLPKAFFQEEEKRPIEKVQKTKIEEYFEKHKKFGTILKIIGILILAGILLFAVLNYVELNNSSNVNSTISDWSYKVNIENSTTLDKFNFSDFSFKIHGNDSVILSIPIISMKNYTYPLSSRMERLQGELGIKPLNYYLIETISGEETNFTISYKNTTKNQEYVENLKKGSNYYYSTEYDSSIYLTLYEQGYSNISTFCRDQSMLTAIELVKLICAEKNNQTILIQIINKNIDMPMDSFTVYSRDNETFDIMKKRIIETEKGMVPYLMNQEYDCGKIYSLEAR